MTDRSGTTNLINNLSEVQSLRRSNQINFTRTLRIRTISKSITLILIELPQTSNLPIQIIHLNNSQNQPIEHINKLNSNNPSEVNINLRTNHKHTNKPTSNISTTSAISILPMITWNGRLVIKNLLEKIWGITSRTTTTSSTLRKLEKTTMRNEKK